MKRIGASKGALEKNRPLLRKGGGAANIGGGGCVSLSNNKKRSLIPNIAPKTD